MTGEVVIDCLVWASGPRARPCDFIGPARTLRNFQARTLPGNFLNLCQVTLRLHSFLGILYGVNAPRATFLIFFSPGRRTASPLGPNFALVPNLPLDLVCDGCFPPESTAEDGHFQLPPSVLCNTSARVDAMRVHLDRNHGMAWIRFIKCTQP